MKYSSNDREIKVWRLDFAHIICRDSILSLGGNADSSTLIGCFGYLIQKCGEYILVDCGIEDLDTVNRTKSSKDDWARNAIEGDLLWNLKRLGVLPEQISEVFLTHSHYDHLSGIVHLKKATIYMAEKEYEYLHKEENPHKKYLTEAISFLEKKKADEKLVLIEEVYAEDDIRCRVIGGHTPGSMLIYIGKYLFTGDVVFLLENIPGEIPIGFSQEPEKAKEAVRICKEHKGTIFTGHDLRCLTISAS